MSTKLNIYGERGVAGFFFAMKFIRYAQNQNKLKLRGLRKIKEEFEDTKGVIRIRKLKDIQHNGQKEKGQTTIWKAYT